ACGHVVLVESAIVRGVELAAAAAVLDQVIPNGAIDLVFPVAPDTPLMGFDVESRSFLIPFACSAQSGAHASSAPHCDFGAVPGRLANPSTLFPVQVPRKHFDGMAQPRFTITWL